MNKPYLYLIAVVFSILYIQCSSKDQTKIPFKEIVVSSSNMETKVQVPVLIDEIAPSSYKSIGLIDTVLVLIDEYESPFLKFYSINTMKYLGQYGVNGDVVNGFINPKYCNQYQNENGRLFFYIMDAQKFTINKIDLKSAINNIKYIPDAIYRIPPPLILRYVSLFVTKKGNFVGNYRGAGDYNKNGRIFLYDTVTKIINWFPYFPGNPRGLSKTAIPYYFYSFCSFNTEKQILASSMYLFKRVDFINFSKQQNYSSVFSDSIFKTPEPYEASPLPDTKIYYSASFSGQKYLYSLCLNKESKYYAKNPSITELHVYEWDGTLKKIVLLDRSNINSFVIDEDSEKLIALQYSTHLRKSIVLQFDLSKYDIF